jgi:predicted GNAT family acetyltransferase
LIEGALEIAREEGFKVAASCSFVANFLDRRPEFSDLKR